MPIRPVVNNKFAPAHKLAKFLNTEIKNWQILPNTYNASNSLTMAEDLIRLNIMPNNKIITLHFNGLHTNLHTKGIIEATKHWLGLGTINKVEQEQLVSALRIIIQQNYFQYNNQYYQPSKGVAMGSALSGTLAELFLQYLEKSYIKRWINSKEICFYTRYVDDILIIIDANRTTEENIAEWFNEIDTN